MMFIFYRTVLLTLFVGTNVAQDKIKINDSRVVEVLTNGNTRSGEFISPLDLYIKDLNDHQWATEEIVCQKKVLDILSNVKNSTLWATWIWDSMQSPSGIFYGSRYQFGNYDQCMKAPWLETHSEYQTKYCLADVKLSNVEPQDTVEQPHSPVQSYINSMSKHSITFNTITWGMCVPVECNSKSISRIVRSLFKHTHLGLTVPITEVSVDPCKVAGLKENHSIEYNLIIFGLAFYIIVAVACTILNSYNGKNLETDSVGNKIIKAFCMKENFKFLFEMYDDDISVLHGIRSVTAITVICGHVWIFNNFIGTVNYLDVDKDIDKYHLTSIAHAELIIDTYLMMSGLLLIKGLMSSNQFNPFLMILKRYFRYTWMLILVILLTMYVLVHTSDGPLWYRMLEVEIDICQKNWWLTFLMLGNYVDTANICYPVLWTVPCDFHLSIVGITIFWLFKKNRRVAFATFTVLSIAAIIMPGVVTYQQKLPGVPPVNMRSIKDYRNIIITNPTYLRSHLRAGPYFVGLAAGYLMSIYKLDKYRNIVSKVYSLIGFVISLGIALQIMVMGGIFQDRYRPYNVWEATLFAAFNRTLWAIAIACLIAFCEYGTVPVFGKLLKSPVFLPVSKLSYGIYLTHTLIFLRVVSSTRSPLNHDMFLMFFHTSGVLVFSAIFSLLLHLFFEAPMNKITNIILFLNKKSKNHSEVKKHGCKNNTHSEQKKTL